MANKTIFQLPEQTGKTNDDVLAIVDSGNTTTSKIKVSTLLSGASPVIKANGTNNIVSDYYATSVINTASTRSLILAGTGNTITTSAVADNVIVGGQDHLISAGSAGAIVGGLNCDITGNGASIFGARNSNTIGGNTGLNIILGGTGNNLSAGYCNVLIAGNQSEITGGEGMNATLSGRYPKIAGARNGIVTGEFAQIASGDYNFIGSGYLNYIASTRSSIVGGSENDIISSSTNGFIGGGGTNLLSGATHTSIIGGANNSIFGNFSVIVGGQYAEIYSGSTYSFIAGGQSNRIYSSGRWSAVVGGNTNHISGTTDNSGIFAGVNNDISGATESVIVGGSNNTNNYDRSVIIGGSGLTTNEDNQVLVQNLKISGQTSGNFYDSGSGTTQTIDWNRGNLQRINLTGNTSITLDNLKPGGTYMLYMNNGGSHSISSITATGYTFKYETNGLPTITHNSTDLFVFDVFSTDTCYVRYHADFG
jgi:hypothetical protein